MYWKPPTSRPPGRGYTILPTTWKARLLLTLAFFAGLFMLGGWIVVLAATGTSTSLFGTIDITFENQTAHEVTVRIGTEANLRLAPGETRTISEAEILWLGKRRVEATDENGNTVYSQRLNRGDLKRMHYRVVIQEPRF